MNEFLWRHGHKLPFVPRLPEVIRLPDEKIFPIGKDGAGLFIARELVRGRAKILHGRLAKSSACFADLVPLDLVLGHGVRALPWYPIPEDLVIFDDRDGFRIAQSFEGLSLTSHVHVVNPPRQVRVGDVVDFECFNGIIYDDRSPPEGYDFIYSTRGRFCTLACPWVVLKRWSVAKVTNPDMVLSVE